MDGVVYVNLIIYGQGFMVVGNGFVCYVGLGMIVNVSGLVEGSIYQFIFYEYGGISFFLVFGIILVVGSFIILGFF